MGKSQKTNVKKTTSVPAKTTSSKKKGVFVEKGAKRHRKNFDDLEITGPSFRRLNQKTINYRMSLPSSKRLLNVFSRRLLKRILQEVTVAVTYSGNTMTVQPKHVQFAAQRLGYNLSLLE